jgi:hypothetical protein
MPDETHEEFYRPARNVVARSVGQEVVALDLQSERYLALDEVGARAWSLLDGTRSVEAIARALADEYAASPEQIADDLREFFAQLVGLGLIEGSRSSCET